MKASALLLGALALLSTGVASAHSLDGVSGFSGGLLHPLLGMDHLLAALAVGLLAARRAKVDLGTAVLPALFMVSMATGAVAGAVGATLVGVEPGIILSLVVLGGILWHGRECHSSLGMALVVLFGLAHGGAHGIEAAGVTLIPYLIGLLLASASLHALGFVFGRLARPWLVRFAGVLLGGFGLLLLAGA